MSIATKQEQNPKVFDIELSSEQFEKTIFDKKVMKEHVNLKQVFGFIRNTMGISYNGVSRFESLPFATELNHIIKYRDTYNSRHKCFVTSHALPKHKWGRVCASGALSLACMKRQTRHAFAFDRYVVIDMKNAQVQMINEILRQHEIEKPGLIAYSADPKAYRQQIMEHYGCDKDVAKQLPITIIRWNI